MVAPNLSLRVDLTGSFIELHQKNAFLLLQKENLLRILFCLQILAS